MVMATDLLDSEQGTDNEEREVVGEAALLHEQLVRHVLAVSGELDLRSDVWGEHSYAKGRGGTTNPQIRSLLPEIEPAADADDIIDVETEPRRLPAPPLDTDDDEEPEADYDDNGDWEERLTALAPSATHVELANVAFSTIRELRLSRLAGGRGRWARGEAVRAAARRLRRALAPHWTGAAPWLHAALLAYLPPPLAALYSEVVTEIRRAVPRLAARLPAPAVAPHVDPLSIVDERRDASAPGPWLAWAPSGSAAEDARWVRRLGALLHTRELRTSAAPLPSAHPDRWCAALAHDARSALSDMLIEAGRRAVVVCGAGAGAALAAWLAGGRVRALLLLAPPLLTAEGPRDRPDDALEEVEVPMLMVVGGGAAQSWRGAAAGLVCGAGARGAGARGAGARRALLLAGADDALRLSRARRRRLNLPQHALDAAIAEECVRWATEAVARRRHDNDATAATNATPPAASVTNRTIEIIEGRVVSRVSGGSPLALVPPRRSPRPPAPPRAPPRPDLAAADIMQLPIVFADDEPDEDARRPRRADDEPTQPRPRYETVPRVRRFVDDEPLTVTSGEVRRARGAGRGYRRVLVAKRGARRAGGGGGGVRPVMLRRRAPPAPQ